MRTRAVSKIGRLPNAIRTHINVQIREGCSFTTIATWLFEQKAPCDIVDLDLKAGEPFSLVWSRAASKKERAHIHCEHSLANWYRTHYRDWLANQESRSDYIRLLEQSEELDRAATEASPSGINSGLNAVIRSLLFEAIGQAHKANSSSTDIARLAHAWARVSSAYNQNESTKMRTTDSIDAGLQALYDDVKDNPDALKLFNQFRDLVKASTPQTS